MRTLIDLTGQRFGRLVVLERAPTNKNGQARWTCICDCGMETTVVSRSLRLGSTKSCGCLVRERVAEAHRTHGHSSPRTPTYRSWIDAIRRCERPDSATARNYASVRICSRWRHSFQAFFDDMGPRPDKTYTLDRIDPWGHYSCGRCRECKKEGWEGNCRWADKRTQRLNQRQLVVRAA